MPGIEINIPAGDRFGRLLQAYLTINQRNAGELVAKKAKDVSMQLYKVCAKLAPTPAKIKGDVKRRGWQVKRAKGAWPRKAGEPKGSAAPLKRMQAAVIGRRLKARGSVAAGWLPAVRRFGGSATGGAQRLAQVRNPKGRVLIEGIDTGAPKITIINGQPGIAKMQQKHNIVRTAFNLASADITKYIRRKLEENNGRLRR